MLGGAAAWPVSANAQQTERMRQVGALMPFPENDLVMQASVTASQRPPARALLRVLVITREDLQQSSNRTLALPNADQLFEQAEQTGQAAAAKYEAQAQLPLLEA